MAAYFRPESLKDALEIRAERVVTVLAGGTDVYPMKAGRTGWGDMRQPDILDISAVGGLRGIEAADGHLRFGAMTTWSDLRRADLPAAFAAYQAAAGDIGGRQVQNRGTLVGNICTASPAGDGIPCLLTLDATIELASVSGTRVVPVAEFIDDYRHTMCRADELVTAILVPRLAENARGKFLKLGARRYLVISIVMVAGVLTVNDGGVISDARVAVGACTPVARRLTALEKALKGQRHADASKIVAAEHLDSLTPIDDVRGSGAYRREAALSLVRDLLLGFSAEQQREAA